LTESPPEDLSTGPAAADRLRGTFPEHALADALDQSGTATRDLLAASDRALVGGERLLVVPAALAGGRVGWAAPAGTVRQQLTERLDALVRAGEIQRTDARALVARFGLAGLPGSAREARAITARGRQATSDAVNRTIRVVAADLSMHPLMPLEAPRLDRARRQLIVGAVLSLMHGPTERFATRLYAHMRVRAELLGDPTFPIAPGDAAERQRRARLANRWLAIAADHLDRDQLPWHVYPLPNESDAGDLDAWHADPGGGNPSVGAIRALAAAGEREALAATDDPQSMLGYLLDGYRPLLELLRVASWAHASKDPFGLPDTILQRDHVDAARSATILSVAQLLAVRGYPDAAVLFAGRAHDLDGDHQTSGPTLRLRRLTVLEGVSYLRGPASVADTRAWHSSLVDHLQRHGYADPGEPLAVADAIFRAEHAAWTAGVPSGANVDELVAPFDDILRDALASSHPENVERHEIVRARLAHVIGGSASPGSADVRSSALAGADRHDEWYCAYPIAVARWDARKNLRGQDEWRR
jgi:hypothetical protein